MVDGAVLGEVLGLYAAPARAFIVALAVLTSLGYAAEDQVPWTDHWPSVVVVSGLVLVSMVWATYFVGLLFHKISTGMRKYPAILFAKACAFDETRLAFTVVPSTASAIISDFKVSVQVFDHELSEWLDVSCGNIPDFISGLPVLVEHHIDEASVLYEVTREGTRRQALEVVVFVEGKTEGKFSHVFSYFGAAEVVEYAWKSSSDDSLGGSAELVVDYAAFI